MIWSMNVCWLKEKLLRNYFKLKVVESSYLEASLELVTNKVRIEKDSSKLVNHNIIYYQLIRNKLGFVGMI